jgi:hypothetical protein
MMKVLIFYFFVISSCMYYACFEKFLGGITGLFVFIIFIGLPFGFGYGRAAGYDRAVKLENSEGNSVNSGDSRNSVDSTLN